MSKKTAAETPIANVSDTARWVAVYRAMESERPDALFIDPFARALAGGHGEQIVESVAKGRQMAWAMIVRTAVMDEIIQRCVDRDGVDTVLNLASGLDTRAYRMKLPETLRWIDADLPGIQDYKAQHMAHATPVCRLETVRVDLRDPVARKALFQRIGKTAGKALVITEGLLVYLSEQQVTDLAQGLHAEKSFHAWLIDIASPMLLAMLQKTWGDSMQQSPMIFAPEQGTAFFAPMGWVEAEFRSTMEESMRLKRRMRFARLIQFLSLFAGKKKREQHRRMSGIVLLKRSATAALNSGGPAP